MRRGLNGEEARIFLGISKRQVFRLAKSKKLTSYRIGGRVVFYEDDLEKYLEKCRQPMKAALTG